MKTRTLIYIAISLLPFLTVSQNKIQGYLDIGAGARTDNNSELGGSTFSINNNKFKNADFTANLEAGINYTIDFRKSISIGAGYAYSRVDNKFDGTIPGTVGALIISDNNWTLDKLYIPLSFSYNFLGSRSIEDLGKGYGSDGDFFIAIGLSYNYFLSSNKLENKPIYDETTDTKKTASEFLSFNKTGIGAIARVGYVIYDDNRTYELFLKYDMEFTPRFKVIETGEELKLSFISFGARFGI